MPPKDTSQQSLDQLVGNRVTIKVAALPAPIEGTVFTATPTAITIIQNVAQDRQNVKIVNTAYIIDIKVSAPKSSEALPLSSKMGAALPTLQDGPAEKLFKLLSRRLKDTEDKRRYAVQGAAANSSVLPLSEVPILAFEGFDVLSRIYPGAYWSADPAHVSIGSSKGAAAAAATEGGLHPVIVVSNQVVITPNASAAAPTACWEKPHVAALDGVTVSDDFASRVQATFLGAVASATKDAATS